MTVKNRFGPLTASALIAAVALSACGEADTSTDSTAAEPAPEEVTIGLYSGGALLDMTQLVALESGAIEEKLDAMGAKVGQEEIGAGPDMVAALFGGTVDFAILPGATVLAINAQRDEVALKSVLCSFTGGGMVFVGAKHYEDSRAGDLSAFDTSTWGYSKEGSQSQVISTMVAESAGMDWQNQTGVALGSISASVPALQAGKVDILAGDANASALALDEGAGYVVHNTHGESEYFDYWRSCAGVVVTTEFADSHPDVVRAVVEAQHEALEQIKTAGDDPDAVLALLPQNFKAAHEETFAVAWELFSPSFDITDGTFDSERVEHTVEYAKAQGVEEPDATALDNSYIGD